MTQVTREPKNSNIELNFQYENLHIFRDTSEPWAVSRNLQVLTYFIGLFKKQFTLKSIPVSIKVHHYNLGFIFSRLISIIIYRFLTDKVISFYDQIKLRAINLSVNVLKNRFFYTPIQHFLYGCVLLYNEDIQNANCIMKCIKLGFYLFIENEIWSILNER